MEYCQPNSYDKNEAIKSIEENASETIEQNASKKIDFKAHLDNLIQEENLTTTLFGKNITRNMMTCMEQLLQVSLPTEIGGSVNSW